MPGSWTLGIVKPDAVAGRKMGAILARIEERGFRLAAGRMVRLGVPEARAFYAVHRERPFFDELVEFMTSGPCFPVALEREDAVAAFRAVIGATNPADAAEGTIRRDFAESMGRNAVHGSDSDENALREIGFFFTEADLARLAG